MKNDNGLGRCSNRKEWWQTACPRSEVDVDVDAGTLTGMLLVTILASHLPVAAETCFTCLFGHDGCTRTVTYSLLVYGQMLDFMTKTCLPQMLSPKRMPCPVYDLGTVVVPALLQHFCTKTTQKPVVAFGSLTSADSRLHLCPRLLLRRCYPRLRPRPRLRRGCPRLRKECANIVTASSAQVDGMRTMGQGIAAQTQKTDKVGGVPATAAVMCQSADNRWGIDCASL